MSKPQTIRVQSIVFRRGFTLLELLVVIAIMGMLAAIAIPAMKGTRQNNALSAANSQMINDLTYARKRAINERSAIHVLFVPPVTNSTDYPTALSQRGYRLYAERTVGDQPGRPTARYLTDWIKLPEGVIIPTDKFSTMGYTFQVAGVSGMEDRVVDPFATADFPDKKLNKMVKYPHISFNSQGGLETADDKMGATVIPFLWPKAQTAQATLSQVTENYNHIVVDGLTGRTRVDTPEIE